MTSPRSMFTEAIEDHLTLKKANAALEAVMPIAAFDVGDPLQRYPGGPVAPALDTAVATVVDPAVAGDAEGMLLEGGFRPPLQPLNGMTPMLSLVEDVEEAPVATDSAPTMFGNAALSGDSVPLVEPSPAPVLRFPGGAGAREAETQDASAAQTGEQPVIVIDADEPLAQDGDASAPREPRPMGANRLKRPTFFGLKRRKRGAGKGDGSGWFSDAPRDFNWDD